MNFDPKTLAKSSAWPTAAGILLGMSMFWFIKGVVEYLVQPIFSFINSDSHPAFIKLADWWHIGCGPFLGVCIIFVIAGFVGVAMIKISKD